MRVPISSVTSHITQEFFIVQLVKHVVYVPNLKTLAIGIKRREVYVVHTEVLDEYAIVPVLVGIAQHRLHLFVRAMVVALVVAFETAAKQILIYINRAERIVCHRDMYGYHIIPLKINALYILLYQDIPAHLIAVYGIPK